MDARLRRLWCGAVLVSWIAAARAEDAAPLPEPAAPPAFAPGDISIGEPIALPFAPAPNRPLPAATPPPSPPLPRAPTAVDRGRESPPAGGAVPGTGWVGLTVAESNAPGRWRVETVAPGGPAARAGIVAGDELRAVNGVAITNADAVAQALTAIAPGQDVRVAVARGESLRDLALRAEPRPTAPPREWQPATATAAAAAPAASPAAPLPPPALEPAPLPSATATAASGPSAAADKRRMALGVRTVPIDAATQARFRLPAAAGAYVVGVVQDLPAAKAGVPPGSVIVSLGERPVRSPVELTHLVTSGPADRPVSLEFILPGGESRRADVVLQALEAPLQEALAGTPAPTEPPALGPAPATVRTERPPAVGSDALRAEILRLRARLDSLESGLNAGSP